MSLTPEDLARRDRVVLNAVAAITASANDMADEAWRIIDDSDSVLLAGFVVGLCAQLIKNAEVTGESVRDHLVRLSRNAHVLLEQER